MTLRENVFARRYFRELRGARAPRDAAMKLVAATLYALRIPFVESFSHSATERRWSDSVVVRVRDEAGTEGFGEGAPRPYVTGETVETMLDHLAGRLWPLVASREVPPAEDLESLAAFVPQTDLAGSHRPERGPCGARDSPCSTARCVARAAGWRRSFRPGGSA